MRTRMIYGIAAAVAALNVCFASLGLCNSLDSAPTVKNVVIIKGSLTKSVGKNPQKTK